MKAAIINGVCDATGLIVQEVPIPSIIKSTEVLVKMNVCAVNPVDCKIRRGFTGGTLTYPAILGRDGAGVIEKIGSQVKRFSIGDEVVGSFRKKRNGSYAGYAVYDESELTKKPKELSFKQAVAFPLVGCTILDMSKRHPKIAKVLNALQNNKPEDLPKEREPLKILIIAASGGTGSVATLIAKNFLHQYFDTKVYAVCSARNEEYVKQLGADVVIDYLKTSAVAGSETTHSTGGRTDLPSICQVITQNGDEYVDLVLDCIGGYYYYDDVCNNLKCCKGDVVYSTIYIPNPNQESMSIGTLFKFGSYFAWNTIKGGINPSSPSYKFVQTVIDTQDLDLLMHNIILTNECYKKIPLHEYNLEQIVEAHQQIESQRTTGKIIVNIDY
ncbi:hypothetical protein ABK040_009384 [Willaertia magna]